MPARCTRDDHQFCFSQLEIFPQDVVTVGQAFGSHDARRLLSVVLDVGEQWKVSESVLSDRCRSALVDKIAATLDLMLSLPEEQAAHPSEIIVPWEWFEAADARGTLRRRVGSAILDERHASAIEHALPALRPRLTSVEQMRKAKSRVKTALHQGAWGWEGLARSASRLAYDPWGATLARRIWLPRFLEAKERSYVLGSVFWAMTYFGYGTRHQLGAVQGCDQRCASGTGDVSAGGDSRMEAGVCAGGGSRAGVGAHTDGGRARAQPWGRFGEVPSGCGAGVFSWPSARRCANTFDECYLRKLTEVSELANYNSWIDLLEAFVRLAGRSLAA